MLDWRTGRRPPADLLAVAGLTALATVAVLVSGPEPSLAGLSGARPAPAVGRLVSLSLGLALVLFLPGYAVLAVLYPDAESDGTEPDPDARSPSRGGLTVVERLGLAPVVSAAVVPATALAVEFSPWLLRTWPLTLGLAGVTLGATAVATIRRWRCPPAERFAPGRRIRAWLARADFEYDGSLATLVLALGVVTATLGVGYAVAVPSAGPDAGFTEVYLGGDRANGSVVARDFPAFAQSESATVLLGVENHEGERVRYDVVVTLQRVERAGASETNATAEESGRTRIAAQDRLSRFQLTVAPNETRIRPLDVTPTMDGRVRLQVLVYRDGVPATPRRSNAYRAVSLWIRVE